MVLLLCATVQAKSTNESPSMKINYIPFGVVPYGQITIKELETNPHYKIWFYGKHNFIGEIIRILEQHKTTKTFDQNLPRLIVSINTDQKSTYYVDYNGVVSRQETNKTYILSKDELKELHNQILRYRGVVDQRPQIDPWEQ